MEALTLVALFLAAAAIYFALKVYFAQQDQDSLIGLQLAQIETGEPADVLLKTLVVQTASKLKRSGWPEEVGGRDEVATWMYEEAFWDRMPPPPQIEIVKILPDGSKLANVARTLVPEVKQLPSRTRGKGGIYKRNYWFGKQRYEIAAYGLLVIFTLAIISNTVLPILKGSEASSFDTVMIFMPVGVISTILFFFASHMVGWEALDWLVGRVRGISVYRKPFTIHETFIIVGSVALFIGVIDLIFTSTFPRLGDYGFLIIFTGVTLLIVGSFLKYLSSKGRGTKKLSRVQKLPMVMLMLHRGSTHERVAKAIKCRRQSIRWHIKKAIKKGLMERDQEGHLTLTDMGRAYVEKSLPGEKI